MTTPVNILWTGGWDSTFCVLDFLLLRNCLVQPVYFLDPDRKSTAQELVAMDRIRRLLVLLHPDTAPRLLATRIIPAAPSAPDDPWDAALAALQDRMHFGSQYAYIGRTIALHRLGPVELAIESPGPVSAMLKRLAVETRVAGAPDHVLPAASAASGDDAAAHVLFRDCRLPLLRVTKKNMVTLALERGWTRLMRETWFCHLPRPGDEPCGFCNPCHTVVKEGLRWRLPWTARARHLWHRRMRDRWPLIYRKASWIGRRLGIRL